MPRAPRDRADPTSGAHVDVLAMAHRISGLMQVYFDSSTLLSIIFSRSRGWTSGASGRGVHERHQPRRNVAATIERVRLERRFERPDGQRRMRSLGRYSPGTGHRCHAVEFSNSWPPMATVVRALDAIHLVTAQAISRLLQCATTGLRDTRPPPGYCCGRHGLRRDRRLASGAPATTSPARSCRSWRLSPCRPVRPRLLRAETSCR